jgi:predicted amidohydrolase YtcJ
MIDDLCIDMAMVDWIIGSLLGHQFIHRCVAMTSLLAAAMVAVGMLAPSPGFAQPTTGGAEGGGCRELVLHNGRISTLDQRDTVVTSVVIRDGQFAAVGTGREIPAHNNCAPLIDLRGHRVVPGLIDNHSHIVSLGLRPGYDVRLETAFSIAEVQQALRNRARDVPAEGFITAIGGWHTTQIAERRLPTRAELDVAVSTHPVMVALAFAGPASVNSRGRAWMEQKGVSVDADGAIAANGPTIAAFDALRAEQTLDDQKRSSREALRYAASLGLTTHHDKGGGWPPRVDGAQGIAQLGTGGSNELHPFTGYDALLALYREGALTAGRVRIFRMWGSQNAWFTRDEGRLGSIEIGKLADLAVLSADVLDATAVPDEAIKRVTSILTIVGGRIVHDSRVLSATGSTPR